MYARKLNWKWDVCLKKTSLQKGCMQGNFTEKGMYARDFNSLNKGWMQGNFIEKDVC